MLKHHSVVIQRNNQAKKKKKRGRLVVCERVVEIKEKLETAKHLNYYAVLQLTVHT